MPPVPKDSQRQSPEWNTNIFSLITFWWLNPLVYLGYKQPLKQHDLYGLSSDRRTKPTFDTFSQYWEPLKNTSIILPMFRTFLIHLILVAFMKLLSSLMMFVPAVVLDHLLTWMIKRAPLLDGILLCRYHLLCKFDRINHQQSI